jgi:hypothetical protein
VTILESRLLHHKTASDDELFIHLDLDGLLALMNAAEAAIATGRARLELRPGSGGIAVGSGTASFARVTLTYSDPAGGGLALAA